MGNEPGKARGASSNNSKQQAPNIDNARNVKYNFLPKKGTKNNDNNNSNTTTTTTGPDSKPLKPVKLLVISGHHDQNFYELFEGCKLLNGRPIEIDQTGWTDFSLCSYSESNNCVCNLRVPRRPIANTKQTQFRTFVPDYLLVRNVCRGMNQYGTINGDSRNLLYGLMISNIPSINTLQSIYCMIDRPLMNARLCQLNKKYGQNQFPILDITYYPIHEEMLITPQYPIVVKIGHGFAGFGKMKLDNHKQFGDLKSVVAMTDMYCTAERYIEGKCDLRIQKIGNHYRAFKRESVSGNWKTNTGTSYVEPIELLPRYKFWADICSESFGGMDIVTVDVLVSKADGQEYILEFNGTASGFGEQDEDNLVLRDYTIQKMNQHFCPQLCDNKEDDNKENNNNEMKENENENEKDKESVVTDNADTKMKTVENENDTAKDTTIATTSTNETQDKDKNKDTTTKEDDNDDNIEPKVTATEDAKNQQEEETDNTQNDP